MDKIEALRAKIKGIDTAVNHLNKLHRDCAAILPLSCEDIISYETVMSQAQKVRAAYNRVLVSELRELMPQTTDSAY